MAIFYLNGKKMIRTTGVKIKQQGYTARQLENLARQQADKIEALARGDAMLDKQIDALRAASEAAGSGARIPSAHDYFIAFKPEGGLQNVSNAKRAHNLFLTHLGADAAKRLDRITRDMCQRFIDDQSKTMSAGTVKKFRAHLSCVFNTAIRDGLLTRSPWAGVKLPKADTVHHEPFTREQIRTLFTKLPPLWQDMVKFCIYSGGQRPVHRSLSNPHHQPNLARCSITLPIHIRATDSIQHILHLNPDISQQVGLEGLQLLRA